MGETQRDDVRKLQDELAELRRRMEAAEGELREIAGRPEVTDQPDASSAFLGEPSVDDESVESPPIPAGLIFEAPPAKESPVEAERVAARTAAARLSFEQRVGTGWLGRIGVVVLLVAAVFFFQYAVDQGWIGEAVRVLMVGGFGLLLIAAGEWAFRKAMKIFSAAITGGGVALLYAAAYTASPNFYDLIPTPVAFGLMCAVTAIGVGLSLRSGMLATAILAQIGAYLTPILLSTGTNQQVALMIYLAVAAIGFLVVAYMNRWQVLAPLSLLGTVIVFVGWYHAFYVADVFAQTVFFGWLLLAPFVVYAVAATRADRAVDELGMGLTAIAGALLAWLLAATAQTAPALYGNLLALNVLILGICWWRNWSRVRPVVLVWTILCFAKWLAMVGQDYAGVETSWSPLATWGWVLFAIFVADVVIRFRRALTPKLDARILIAAGSGLLWVVGDVGLTNPAMLASLASLNVIVLGVCLLRRWTWPRVSVLVWSVLCFLHVSIGSWLFNGLSGDQSAFYAMWGWVVFGLFVADAIIRALPRVAMATKRPDSFLVTAAAGLLVLWTAGALEFTDSAAFGHVLAINGILLAMGWRMRWDWPRAAALAWTAVCFLGLAADQLLDTIPVSPRPWLFATWAWVLFGLFTADVLARLRWELSAALRKYNATLATLATAAMFAATWRLLDNVLPDWGVAVYTAGLSAAAIIAAIALRKLTDRSVLSYAYLGQGLVLAAFVAPMALDEISVTVAWSAQAAVAMLLARRLKERMLLVKSTVMLMLAWLHFLAIDLQAEAVGEVLVTLAGVGINTAMLSAAALAAGAVLSAGILRAGAAIWDEAIEKALALVIVCAAVAVWASQTSTQLPAITATWWWLIVPAGAGAVAVAQRRNTYALLATLALVVVMGRFFLHNTLYLRLADGPDVARQIVLNWQSALGLVLAVGALIWSRCLARRRNIWPQPAAFATVLALLAAILVVWTGSFEIDRTFAIWQARSAQAVDQARNMAYSVWWAACAIALLVTGLLVRHTPSRYLALALLAITLGKVLLVDMADVETVWRILSFLATGLVLIGSSLAYQRYFGRTTKPEQTGDSP
ncbi:hypothetical protein LCGC14_0276340 [marine sediment metagenome]|uniref:DUF2339 domain-containing protein n=1 Tax=marine sediment metagenome TaxID=412755 RepID=A0A0F9WI74_9ZZZZ|nr:DUF2339 domain-containing protein [Phycisphaerae bacterium]HDZ43908.1 DUF2339 domain-containing protein [Phycisphaerae bacterium]